MSMHVRYVVEKGAVKVKVTPTTGRKDPREFRVS
jgi:hypothetical protein